MTEPTIFAQSGHTQQGPGVAGPSSLKSFCSHKDETQANQSEPIALGSAPVAGRRICPGGWDPAYIHPPLDLGPSNTPRDSHGVCAECAWRYRALSEAAARRREEEP